MIRRLLTVAVMFALLGPVPPSASADAGTIVVTNTGDSGSGSLRDAIANAPAGAQVIVPRGTYALTSDELRIQRSLTISGAGAGATTIVAQPVDVPFRIFHTLGAGNQITIRGVTIQGGLALPPGGTTAVGGGVMNEQATLTLSDDVITRNFADADSVVAGGSGGTAVGGGVYNVGSLNLVDTKVLSNGVSANAALSGGHGGNAFGGGVYSAGALAIRGSTLAGNTAEALGHSGGTPTSDFGGLGRGGGLMAVQDGPKSISASTIEDNVVHTSAPTGVVGGEAAGAGAYLDGGSGAISATNLTITGNIAQADGGDTLGGGMLLTGQGRGHSLTNATISGNAATGGIANLGGNQGGDIFLAPTTGAAIENTIVSAGQGDTGSENCAMRGTPSSLGHNIDSRDECGFHGPADQTTKNPLLDPISDNGGPVPTLALKSGSPAVDAGAANACPTTDARGALRPSGGGCDIGAFEVATPSATTGQAGSVTTSSAILSGTASDPDVATGSAFFQYGATTGYGSSTPAQPVAAATTQVQVSAVADGLAPGTTYHFRIVVHNAAGTVSGADQTFTTASPVTVPPAPRIVIRSISVAGATVSVSLACEGVAGQRCAGAVRGTSRERLRGRAIVSVSANAAKRASNTTRTVTVASGSYAVPAGRVGTVRITANALGRRLLASFYRLPARFVFSGPPQVSRTITFNYPRIKSDVVNNWFLKFPPCGACMTLATQLAIPVLPSGGAQVTVSCRGRGCPFARRVLRPRGRTVTFTNLLVHRPLAPGTRVGVLITAPNHVGEAVFYTMRPGTFPRLTTLCLPPGVRAPVACRPSS